MTPEPTRGEKAVDHYKAWATADCVRKFSGKSKDDFFASETRFLDRIGPELDSVCDIGCASGRLIELLSSYRADVDYTGIDLVEHGIRAGQARYPEQNFLLGNALELELDRTFALVNATGVVQHEPRFAELIGRMLEWSDRYVLFDCKLAAICHHLVDRDQAFVTIDDERLYFNVLSVAEFTRWLTELPDVRRVELFGYETAPNERTTVPSHALPMASVGILLDKRAAGPISIVAEVPSFLGLPDGHGAVHRA